MFQEAHGTSEYSRTRTCPSLELKLVLEVTDMESRMVTAWLHAEAATTLLHLRPEYPAKLTTG
jgi:hypothetical protein